MEGYQEGEYMTPIIAKAVACIAARGWSVRAELVRAGISVEKSLEQSIEVLKLRRPRVRYKSEKAQIEQDLQILREALEETVLKNSRKLQEALR